jgi:hypothetical protein
MKEQAYAVSAAIATNLFNCEIILGNLLIYYTGKTVYC